MVKKGWKNYDVFQSKRHSNAKKYGSAGGKYAKPKKRFKSSITIEKVPYTKKGTPDSKADFKLKGQMDSSPAGTTAEWKAFAKKHGLSLSISPANINQVQLGDIVFKNGKRFMVDEKSMGLVYLYDEKGNLHEIQKEELYLYEKDSDKDAVPDSKDCQPFNPKKQDSEYYISGKTAKVVDAKGVKTLYSYGTKVAEIKNGKVEVYGLFTHTTHNHLTKFLRSNGFKSESGKQVMADYGAKDKPQKSDTAEMMKTTGMVAMMGELFADTEKDKNDWKMRMLKAGLGNRGFNPPADWDSLPEAEKTKRLDKVIAVARGTDEGESSKFKSVMQSFKQKPDTQKQRLTIEPTYVPQGRGNDANAGKRDLHYKIREWGFVFPSKKDAEKYANEHIEVNGEIIKKNKR